MVLTGYTGTLPVPTFTPSAHQVLIESDEGVFLPAYTCNFAGNCQTNTACDNTTSTTCLGIKVNVTGPITNALHIFPEASIDGVTYIHEYSEMGAIQFGPAFCMGGCKDVTEMLFVAYGDVRGTKDFCAGGCGVLNDT